MNTAQINAWKVGKRFSQNKKKLTSLIKIDQNQCNSAWIQPQNKAIVTKAEFQHDAFRTTISKHEISQATCECHADTDEAVMRYWKNYINCINRKHYFPGFKSKCLTMKEKRHYFSCIYGKNIMEQLRWGAVPTEDPKGNTKRKKLVYIITRGHYELMHNWHKEGRYVVVTDLYMPTFMRMCILFRRHHRGD